MSEQSEFIWGIDLGGTKIEGVVLRRSNLKEVIFRDRIATEATGGYNHVISRIGQMVGLMQQQTGMTCHRLGIGTPGTMDPQTGLLKNSNTTDLNGKPFLSDLIQSTGKEIEMANDANCFALAESQLGVVQDILPDAKVVFGVIMGTGVGGGIVVDGHVINGRQGIAGEWGHNFLHESGGKCYCGKSGCIEMVLAGPSLERHYYQLSGNRKRLKEIVASQDTDEHAAAIIERLHHFFGIALSTAINLLDPDVIVIGGGVGNIESLYAEGLQRVKKHVFNDRLDTKIVAPKLGDSAGVFGAALLTV